MISPLKLRRRRPPKCVVLQKSGCARGEKQPLGGGELFTGWTDLYFSPYRVKVLHSFGERTQLQIHLSRTTLYRSLHELRVQPSLQQSSTALSPVRVEPRAASERAKWLWGVDIGLW